MRPDNQQGLMPSLLDRLTDPEASGNALRDGYGAEQVAAAVLRDLEELLNTRLTALDIPADCAETLGSIAAFGLPDLSNVPASTIEQRATIGRTLETIIMRFEPRLRDVRAT
ncbi:MAG: type VI secretion system baseplate subunit TssE, partial [Gemmataceae bacterium]|nr:type VI secretion system baseplate subunit TssE [Gemmataceae bacterium]